MVCSSNQNRSMEAHHLFKRHGFDVSSYGTGAHVKLPGPSLREPNVYEFGTPYKQMFDDLRRKDPELYLLSALTQFKFFNSLYILFEKWNLLWLVNCLRYKRNGILPMLKRNIGVKAAPQRWQDNALDGPFDIIFTFEEKVFDMVVEGWHLRSSLSFLFRHLYLY